MKYLTEGMEPKEALEYFENICGIPHGSGNEAELAKYIIDIAKKKDWKHMKTGMETYWFVWLQAKVVKILHTF